MRYQAGKLADGAPTAFAARVSDIARDQVARRANQTMRRNAARDKIRYARVPMGGETCTFCAMLASRGFAYKSASAAGEGNHYHPNCRCKVVPETAGSVEGYDPDEWLGRWQAMRDIDADPRLTAAQKLEAKGRIAESASRLGSGLGSGVYPPMEPVEGMRYDPADEKSVRQFISDAIELIKDEPVEHAYALQADGTVMHSSGDSIGTGMGGLASNGATIIHNHPIESGEPGSFGADDVKWVSENPEINALHVISDGVLYTITPTDLTSSASWDWAYGKLTLGQLMDAEDSKHLTMEVLADGGYIEYQWREV